ncbi:flagellar hook assembly protein FlgD [Exiguobacterium sp. LL15]|uniref:flagellar hook assembly protein FlgD n=1 Tax=Exiguobacterium sp. LL15 TaxID=2950547 RepID=UPI00210C589D|nr:flagellar hook assembly protein FlgD [Exiguobacterium sp. LL15]MCQ4089891.1 flagellar hook assembly protein FlgD [Exiguobacterium sp. LL15]
MTEGIKNDGSSFQLPEKKQTVSNNSMDKDMFMKILIAQLSNQDPTAPMEDKEFIAQMAQFSSLEQMQSIGKGMETMILNQHAGALMTYSNLIGKEVSYTPSANAEDETSSTEESATVLSVKRDGVDVIAELSNGKRVSVYDLTQIKSKEEK